MSDNSPWNWIDAALADLRRRGLLRGLSTRSGAQGAVIQVAGKELINFGSNDYLGLSADPRVIAAAEEGLRSAGWGSGASPLVTGRGTWHERLEQRLAEFEGTEAALVFPSGFAANAGTVAALVGAGDAIFADAKNHASLIDGCRLSRADVHIYPHANVAALETLLATHQADRRLIVTDALFSMDGDFAPLPELCALAARFDCMLLIDEAHATGIWGAHGRGVSEHLGVETHAPLRVGTLSKALGGVGGFVVGRRTPIEWLWNRARPYVFSTAGPAAAAAAACAAIDIVRAEPERRQRVQRIATDVADELRRQGWRLGTTTSQIIPVYLGDPERTMQAAAALRERGLWVPGIRPPSVPIGESLLRISLCATHSDAMIERLLDALMWSRTSQV